MALKGLSGKTEGVLDRVLGIIVILAILGGTITLVFSNMDSVINAFTDYSGNSTVLNALVPVFGLVLGVLIVLGIVKVIRRFSDI